MKKNLLMLFIILFNVLLIGIAQAALPPIPQVCPSVGAIQTVDLSRRVVQGNNGLWFAGRRHQRYDTNNMWTFILANIPASTASEAYVKAKAGLKSLAFQIGPLPGQDHWFCYYNTAEGYAGLAVNPEILFDQGSKYLS